MADLDSAFTWIATLTTAWADDDLQRPGVVDPRDPVRSYGARATRGARSAPAPKLARGRRP